MISIKRLLVRILEMPALFVSEEGCSDRGIYELLVFESTYF